MYVLLSTIKIKLILRNKLYVG